MKPEFFKHAKDSFYRYVRLKYRLDNKIIENNEWLEKQMEFSNSEDTVLPTTAFVFNAIANKHADAMDNYPEPNILPRHMDDEKEAKALSKIIPVQMEISGFKKVYSDNWWTKLKHGLSVYGVFFKNDDNSGMGEVVVRKLDVLNVFWEPYISDLQESEFLFITSFERTENLKEMYPKKQIIPYQEEVQIQRMRHTWDEELYKEKSLVVDCYYKTSSGVHMLKFCGETLLDSTEDRGMDTLYEHGLYPVVADTIFSSGEQVGGIGMIELLKNPQEYVNKLDSIISRNALLSGKIRFMVKDNGGINEHELTDLSSDIIHVAGSVSDDNVRQFQASPLDAFIINHRQSKIAEMKEIAGNRDFQQGGSSNGVTAYSAIAALQQSGEKLSRDMIYESYNAYKQIIFMCIEIIRQFYFEPRFYRADASDGTYEYIAYSNDGLMKKPSAINGYERRPEFDVEVSVQKNNPYSKAEQNELAKQLYQLGVFDSPNAEKASMLLELMQFEGKAKVMEYLKLQQNKEEQNNESSTETERKQGGSRSTANNIQTVQTV